MKDLDIKPDRISHIYADSEEIAQVLQDSYDTYWTSEAAAHILGMYAALCDLEDQHLYLLSRLKIEVH